MNDLIEVEKFKQNEDELVNAIVNSKGDNLPAVLDDVIEVFEFTDFKAKAWKILSSKLGKLDEQTELYQSAIRSGQQWGIAALYAQKRMGEITKEMPHGKPIHKKYQPSSLPYGKEDKLKNIGIPLKKAHEAEQIAAHPDILDDVIESSTKRGEIPTKTAVLNAIRIEKQKESNERAKRKGDKKIINEATTATKDYYDSVKGFEQAIKTALLNARVGKFAPEGLNFMIKKHDKIRQLLKQLEEAL